MVQGFSGRLQGVFYITLFSPHRNCHFGKIMGIGVEKMKKFIPLFFLAVSFAYIESAVVVYLRELYYPEGFKFPLKLIPSNIGLIEVGREAATLATIAAIGFVSGKTLCKKISYSIFVFGIWDLFYYIWLKVFLDWPESLLTLDILFLIPLPWVAP